MKYIFPRELHYFKNSFFFFFIPRARPAKLPPQARLCVMAVLCHHSFPAGEGERPGSSHHRQATQPGRCKGEVGRQLSRTENIRPEASLHTRLLLFLSFFFFFLFCLKWERCNGSYFLRVTIGWQVSPRGVQRGGRRTLIQYLNQQEYRCKKLP